jgi:hypothetical protein
MRKITLTPEVENALQFLKIHAERAVTIEAVRPHWEILIKAVEDIKQPECEVMQ